MIYFIVIATAILSIAIFNEIVIIVQIKSKMEISENVQLLDHSLSKNEDIEPLNYKLQRSLVYTLGFGFCLLILFLLVVMVQNDVISKSPIDLMYRLL